MNERGSYCLLFLALATLTQGQYSLQQVLRVLPMNARVNKLAAALSQSLPPDSVSLVPAIPR